jgi:hypothetical protein
MSTQTSYVYDDGGTDVVGQSKRKKTRRSSRKVFHDYVIDSLNLFHISVYAPRAQFIPTSVPHGILSLMRQSQMYAKRCASTMPRILGWPTASLAVCSGLACWNGVPLALMRHPVDIQAVSV